MRKIESLGAFAREVRDAKADRALMLVEFTQPQCRSCVAVHNKLTALVRSRPQHRIFDVDLKTAEGWKIAERVGGVKFCPTVCVYDRGELVFFKPVPVKKYDELENMIDTYEDELARVGPELFFGG